MPTSRVAIAILAAGHGARFGGGKLLAGLAGKPLIRHAVDAALASGVGPVSVVVSEGDADLASALPSEVEVISNPHASEGIASSLRAALASLEPRGELGAVCIGLGDQPLVGAEAYRRLAAAHVGGADLAVATYRDQPRNPVLLGRAHWREALTLTGDSGARRLFGQHAVARVACDDTGDPSDVDTRDDLWEIERRSILARPSA